MSFPSPGHNNEQKEEENSQIKDAVSLKNSSKEVFEEKEAVEQTDLQMIDQNQVTLKDGNHGKKANEHCKEDVNSLLTIKKRSSPKDLQTNEASLKNSSKEGFEEIEAIMKTDLQIMDQKQVTIKDGNHGIKKPMNTIKMM